MHRSQKTSPSANLLLLATLVGMRYLTQVDWQIRLGHLVHAQPLARPNTIIHACGRSGAARKANPLRGGDAKPRTCEGVQVAGLPNGGGVLTRSPRAPPL